MGNENMNNPQNPQNGGKTVDRDEKGIPDKQASNRT